MKTASLIENAPIVEKGPVVMAVEDDSVSLRVIKSALEKKGYHVVTAVSGEEALKELKVLVPSVLILDVMMPGISGHDLCNLVKQNERLREVPVVFLTASDAPKDFKIGQELGAVLYLTKPIRPDRLLQAVGMLCPPPRS